jgi:hypothetical protein
MGTGLYILPCIYLTMWPVYLLQLLLPSAMSDWLGGDPWPIESLISLIAWLLLAALAAVVSDRLLVWRKRKDVKKV